MSSAIPIRNGGDPSIPLQFHRDSFAHSQGMGGISWGGASVGSWLRDEVLMATKENKEVANNFGSLLSGSAIGDSMDHNDAHHDSAMGSMAISPDQPGYFPSIEANFCRDYSCCGNILPTLHDLLRHYEEQHISPSPPDEPPVMRRMQNIETVSTNDVFLPFDQSRPGIGGSVLPSGNNAQDNRGDGHGGALHRYNSNTLGDSRNMSGSNSMAASPNTSNDAAAMGLHDSGMDVGNDYNRLGNGNNHGHHQAFAPPSFQPLNQGMNHYNALTSVPSVLSRSKHPSNRLGGDGLSDVGARFGNDGSGATATTGRLSLGDDEEPTIDDPARQLYMLERNENKPFKCPVIGCEKTYKNQNGLKYHRQHGHQNQTLHLNDDGTYSIIDPLSNTPYPDGMGMEKDKPYRCEICGKRYKNLNGLKYHRAHSTH